MNLQRKLTLAVVTGAIAFGAGHVVQTRAAMRGHAHETKLIVSSVTPVAAGPDAIFHERRPLFPEVPELTVQSQSPIDLPPPATEKAVEAPEIVPEPEPVTPMPQPIDCRPEMELIPQPGAMIGLSIQAPCNANERIVLRHAGLAVTGKLSDNGSFFGRIPALTDMARVEVLFSSGDRISDRLMIAGAAKHRRFIVQWQDADRFQLHAFEGTAGYGQPGHFSSASAGVAGQGPYHVQLGDPSTPLPLLAEVFTFGLGRDAEIVLEAEITEATCGREILGETLLAEGGLVKIADLTVTMPGCEAVGDILVLKSLVRDMKLAAAR